jgi:hypothetical protein
MCFDSDSSPPIAVLSGGALTHEDVVLESDDARRAATASPARSASTAGRRWTS